MFEAQKTQHCTECEAKAKRIEELEDRNIVLERTMAEMERCLWAAKSHIQMMQNEACLYLQPEPEDCNEAWLISRMLFNLDGPIQRSLFVDIDKVLKGGGE